MPLKGCKLQLILPNMEFSNLFKRISMVLVLCSFFSWGKSQNAARVTLSGFVSDVETGEYYGNVRITVLPDGVSTYTNNYGFYSVTLERKQIQKRVAYYQFGGFELDSFVWNSNGDTSVHFKIRAKVQAEQIEAVEIRSKKNTVADKVEMSRIDIPVNQIKEIPALFGEKDVLKVIQLLPGVQAGGE